MQGTKQYVKQTYLYGTCFKNHCELYKPRQLKLCFMSHNNVTGKSRQYATNDSGYYLMYCAKATEIMAHQKWSNMFLWCDVNVVLAVQW